MTCGIYAIRNTKTGKVYIGSSINIERRFSNHKQELKNNKHHNKYLQRAWNKYGSDLFEFQIIKKCLKRNLVKYEQIYLDQLQATDPKWGYNCHSEAYRFNLTSKELSEQTKKQWSDPTIREKMISGMRKAAKKRSKVGPNTGKKFSKEWRKKLSESAKKRHSDIEQRLKHSEIMKQKWTDPVFRAKMLQIRKTQRKRKSAVV